MLLINISMAQTNSQLVPETWRYQVGNCLATSIINDTDNYYFFIADHTDHANSQLQPLNDNISNNTVWPYRNMIEGKYIDPTTICPVINYIPYKSNFVFTMYDDQVNLAGLPYYCVVNAASFFHVFKCIYNNNNANSTFQPNFGDISGANTNIYQTSDGYIWKYMYTVTSNQVKQFATPAYFPVFPNTTVQSGAVCGAIDAVLIQNPGTGYNNYITGTFQGPDLRIGGVTTIYQISNLTTSAVNGFYTGCLIYLNSGTGMGQFANVIDYFCNSNGNYISIDQAFATPPLNGTTYQIYPSVVITGQGTQTINAIAMGLVNSLASNSIYDVQMIQTGAGYHFGTAVAVANAVVGVLTQANLRPILSPPGGHGFNPAKELGSNSFEISVTLSNSETNTILTTNKFQQIGIIKNPMFANVNLQLTNVIGSFLTSETVYKLNYIRVITDATVASNSNIVSANDGMFAQQFGSNGNFAVNHIYISANNGNLNELLVINGIINSTALTLTTNSLFSSNSASLYVIQFLANSIISNVISSSSLMVTNVTAAYNTGDFVIGGTSGAIGTVNTVVRNGVSKNFNTFVQLHKYTGSLTFRSFVPNEIVYQGNLQTANALLHSTSVVNGAITMYVSNQVGIFNNTITGANSGAIMTVSNAYAGELVFETGDIVYLENINAIYRQNNQNETFQLIWNF